MSMDRVTQSTPDRAPYSPPTVRPQSSTGMCMGRMTLPALGIMWNSWGSTSPMATNRAVRTMLLMFSLDDVMGILLLLN